MKSKLAIFIAATALFVGVWFVRPVSAYQYKTLGEYSNIWIYYYNGWYRINWSDNDPNFWYDGYWHFKVNQTGYESNKSSAEEALNWVNNNLNTRFTDEYNTGDQWFNSYLNIYQGSYNGTIPDFTILPAPEEEETWWSSVKDAFMEFVGSDAMSALISGDWLDYLDEVLFGDLWTVKVGEGEDELVEFYTVSATPSPSPSPTPTQIPVQINIDPGTGDITYHYNVIVSGTPIPTSSPVNPNPPGSGGGGGGSGLTEPVGVEDYYEPDDSLSIPNLRIFQFQLDLPGSTTDIGVDSLDNNFEVMNGYLEDNAEAITTVSSFFQVIPTDWFLLLGAIACFPIIAAMIKSLLGG